MKVQEQKIAQREENDEMFKWGLQLREQLNNYEEIIEKLDGLLREKELADRNRSMKSEKKKQELRTQKQYNKKLISK